MRKGHDRRFNKHMTALGHAVAAWAALEFAIGEAIWELANVEREAGACVTAQLVGPGPRVRALVALLELRGLMRISSKPQTSSRKKPLGSVPFATA
jgi:hypothetical protein